MMSKSLRFLLVFSLPILLPGCPPPCQYEPDTSVGEIHQEMIGRWEGEARVSATDIRPVVIEFYDVGFRFEGHNGEVPFVATGSWGTTVHQDDWNRLDLYFLCIEGHPEISPNWTIWVYYLDGNTLDFHSHNDGPDDEGTPYQDAPFYSLNRIN